MKVLFVLAFLAFQHSSQAFPNKEAANIVEGAEEKNLYSKVESQLNDNLYHFLVALTSVDMEELHANSRYIKDLIKATQEHTLDYSGVVENLSTLMEQPKEEQLVNFLVLLRKKLHLREPRFVFEAMDAMLDIFSSVDLAQVTDIVRQTPDLVAGMSEMIGGIVDVIEDIDL